MLEWLNSLPACHHHSVAETDLQRCQQHAEMALYESIMPKSLNPPNKALTQHCFIIIHHRGPKGYNVISILQLKKIHFHNIDDTK